MDDRAERRMSESWERLEKGGYVPVTPLGPPPQGEPLLSSQDQAPATSGAIPVRENGYAGITPLGPPPQGEPLLAPQARPTVPNGQPQAQVQPQTTTTGQPQTQTQHVDLKG